MAQHFAIPLSNLYQLCLQSFPLMLFITNWPHSCFHSSFTIAVRTYVVWQNMRCGTLPVVWLACCIWRNPTHLSAAHRPKQATAQSLHADSSKKWARLSSWSYPDLTIHPLVEYPMQNKCVFLLKWIKSGHAYVADSSLNGPVCPLGHILTSQYILSRIYYAYNVSSR